MFDFGPRQDEQLCDAIRSRDMSATERATEELWAKQSSVSLCYATMTAIDERNLEALGYLLHHSQVNENVAWAAAQSEDVRVVQVILDRGWHMDKSFGGSSIPSMLSFAVCNHEYLDWLLGKGANPNAISCINETVLSFAIRGGTMKVVKRLFGLDIMDTSRGDLLHCAVHREESEDTVELINTLVLEKGAQVDAYEFDNDIAPMMRYGYPWGTALHTACRNENISAVKALLRHGARADQLMKRCDNLVHPTPLELASDKPVIRALLLESLGA